MKILLVEDDRHVASFIRKGFESEGYLIDIAYDGTIACSLFNKNNYSIIILDINLPLINGFDLCGIFKKSNPKIPVIFLTALDRIDDKVKGFELGGDDYLVKPFEFKELLIRVRSLLKRNFNSDIGQKIIAGDLELDIQSKIVQRDGKTIDLTAREFSLLQYLMLNKNRIVSRVDISEEVWDINFDTNTNIIDVYINYLRKKIDKDYEKKLLHTVVGRGYILKDK
jgi:two-component system copper resistance phosphate regulon response regulator CusR